MSGDPHEILAAAVRESGLVDAASGGVALVSGGPDSAALAAGLSVTTSRLVGLHLNYRLREDSGSDEETARLLCAELGIELIVERPDLAAGNVQAAARDARYEAAERLRAARDLEWIATGHTRTDLAETVLYRLASSPGRRALLGLAPRRGRLIRPILSLTRDETRELATAAGLPFRDDPSNDDTRLARARIRADVMPVMREINSAAEANVAETWAELAEEAQALEELAADVLTAAAVPGGVAGAGPAAGVAAISVDTLRELDPALRRIVIRALAARASGIDLSLSRERAGLIWRLAMTNEGGEVDLGRGWRAVCEAGHIRIAGAPIAPPEPVSLPVPGECSFGGWRLRAELATGKVQPRGPDVATLDTRSVESPLLVRSAQPGDRMRPLGLDGTKALSDLFTDRGVPRSLRDGLPVVVCGDEIAWVAGVAIGDRFRLRDGADGAVVLTARQ